jgi:hypothetical protein
MQKRVFDVRVSWSALLPNEYTQHGKVDRLCGRPDENYAVLCVRKLLRDLLMATIRLVKLLILREINRASPCSAFNGYELLDDGTTTVQRDPKTAVLAVYQNRQKQLIGEIYFWRLGEGPSAKKMRGSVQRNGE